ncbi:lysine-specific histone demethylase 1B-like [Dermacentor silvarum]|uniref:lysine-specific histone demethylase 1B-like n=1 Tax=Dermacentor silvarum TaxID=543639 RepID=UPI00210144EB|nr:lysine-specific histone demethylase 1B-like [Dermacentor silvarum]
MVSLNLCTARCCGDGYTSRWYHLSSGEHFCNECFDYYYRSTKPGYVEYSGWREHWSRNARLKASLRLFMADQVLPFWAQCVRCRKWRCLPKRDDLTPEFVDTFTCSYIPSYDNTSAEQFALLINNVDFQPGGGWIQRFREAQRCLQSRHR